MTTLQITELPISNVQPHPQNVRRELRGIDELADSIKAEGLHQPIIVAPAADEYVVVMGNSRHAACTQLGWGTIPCIVRTDLDTEVKVLSAMLAENCARNDLTITEEGDAFQRLLDLDLTTATVAKRAGRSAKQVADRVTIACQPDAVRTAVDDKQLSLTDALTLAELDDDHERYARAVAAIGTPSFRYTLESQIGARRNITQGENLRAKAIADGFIEITEDEASALPDGQSLERIQYYSDDLEPADDIRFTLFGPNPELYPPSLRWYRIVTDTPATDGPDTGAESTDAAASPARPEQPEWARREAEQRAAENAERTTAREQRRRWLADLWTDGIGQYEAQASTARALLRDVVHHAFYDSADPARALALFLEDAATEPVDSREWSMLRLAFMTWWQCCGFEAEIELSNYGPDFWEPPVARYLETLRDVLGYELSDIEDALLDTYHAQSGSGDGDD